MLETIIFTLLIAGNGFTNALEFSANQAFNAEYSAGSDLTHGALTVAANMDKINQNSWNATLTAMVPRLTQVQKGIDIMAKSITKLMSAFSNGNAKGTNIITIPHELSQSLTTSLLNLRTSFENLEHSKLIQVIANNQDVLQSQNSEIVLPASVAHRLIAILKYIVTQFVNLKTYAVDLKNDLMKLSNLLKKDGVSSFAPFLFKEGAQAVKKMATRFGFIGSDFESLVQMFEQAGQHQSDGNSNIPAWNATVAVSVTVQKIADNFDHIAQDAQLLMDGIVSDSY